MPPEVHLSQDYMAVRRGSASVLRCVVGGDSPLNIQWKKDGIPIDGAAQPRYTIHQTKFLSFSVAVNFIFRKNSQSMVLSSFHTQVQLVDIAHTINKNNVISEIHQAKREFFLFFWAGFAHDSLYYMNRPRFLQSTERILLVSSILDEVLWPFIGIIQDSLQE